MAHFYWSVLKGLQAAIYTSLICSLSPCPSTLLVCPPPPALSMLVVPQMAIFSRETDINGTSAHRKSKREGHDETNLPFFFHVTYSVKHPENATAVSACIQVGAMQMML